MSDLSAYPRPDFDRSGEWRSLEGTWEFARLAPGESTLPLRRGFEETIEVPYAWESERSGVGAPWLAAAAYRRTVTVPPAWRDRRTVVHFGGVHHRARVLANGRLLAEHEGVGPFSCDVTDGIGPDGDVELTVFVDAPIDKRFICHGKQRSLPLDDYDSCAFTPTSGIWQPVWIEPRPPTYVASVRCTTALSLDALSVVVGVAGPESAGARVELELVDPDRGAVARASAATCDAPLELRLADPRPWSPADPHLYSLQVRTVARDGVDAVSVPVGVRTIAAVGDELRLNGERLYLRGVLDQGYWPDTGLTAPSTDALVHDLMLARAAGYNLVRKHIKLEDPRWLHAADRAGMLVWAEPPGTGRYAPAAIDAFQIALRRMVERDGNHPSIVIWGAFNEEWGLDWGVAESAALQDEVRGAAQLLRRLDPSRPIVDNSGWSHVDTDLVDWHYYEPDLGAWRKNVTALVEQENAEIPVPLHPPALEMKPLHATPARENEKKPNLNGEYGWGGTSLERGWHLKWQTQELRRHDALCGYVYTELCDVEHEFAGVYRADRSRKDFGNMDPADVNAETVLVIDLLPLAPGCDIETAGPVSVDVALSHHGREALTGALAWQWGPILGAAPRHWAAGGERELSASPFVLGAPVRVETSLPEGWSTGRLHLALFCAGALTARSALDVVRAGAWRP